MANRIKSLSAENLTTTEPHNKAFHYASLLLDELDIKDSRANERLRYALISWIKRGSDHSIEPMPPDYLRLRSARLVRRPREIPLPSAPTQLLASVPS